MASGIAVKNYIWPSGLGVTRVSAEGVPAGETAIVVENAFVDHLAEPGSGKAARGAADKRADKRAEQTASQHARRTGYNTDGHAELSTGQATGSTADAAADSTDDASRLAREVTGLDASVAAVGTNLIHGFPLGIGSDGRGKEFAAQQCQPPEECLNR